MRSVRLLRNDVFRAFKPFWTAGYLGKSRRSKDPADPAKGETEENALRDPYEGNYSFVDCDQYTKVTLIGAAGRVGRTLSLLLKTCPMVDHLCLFDIDKSVKGIGVDVSHIDTKCCVTSVCGMKNVHKALDAPDVVVIAAGYPSSPSLSGKKLFEKNAPIVAGLSEACARFCPKACVVLITSPINSLVPVMGEVYQMITSRIPSRKLFGLTTLDVVRANTFVAEVVRKDPNSIIVPVIGGTSQETIVPVISQMKPCCKIKRGEMLALTECVKRAEGNLSDCQNCGTRGASSLSTAYAAFRFTSSLLMALKGVTDITECAYVKSDIIPELEYMASPVKLGIRGIEHNFGYPHLSGNECASQIGKPIKLNLNLVENLRLNTSNHGFQERKAKAFQAQRMYHTGNANSFRYHDYVQSKTTERYKKYLMEDRKRILKPTKALNILKYKTTSIQQGSERPPRKAKLEQTHCKLLNASAKQKFRSFNAQRKFPSTASMLLMIDRDRKERLEKNCDLALREDSTKYANNDVRSKAIGDEENGSLDVLEAEDDEEEEVENAGHNRKDLIVSKKEKDDTEKYKDFILKQLQELKRENEDLKRRILQIMENKKLETALHDNLELEKTKLKACWLVMSSTMDAFSNFCKKFTSKSDPSLVVTRDRGSDEEEESEDAGDGQESPADKKEETYDEKYYNFLKKLMEDQVEGDKTRNRVRIGK